jgi:membrane protein DedA with SNARE-associated domain
VFDPSTVTTVQELITAYGLWVLFAFVASESIGVPLPGEAALIAAALYAGSTHGIDILAVITVAAAGAVAGDNIGYLIGRWLGLPLLARYGHHVRLTEGRLKVGRYLFLRHGGKIVFFGRFVAFLRVFAALLAGANHMRWGRFLIMNMLGGVSWAVLVGGGAYVLGEQVKAVAFPIGLLLLAIAITLIVIGALYFRSHEKNIEERARIALATDLET